MKLCWLMSKLCWIYGHYFIMSIARKKALSMITPFPVFPAVIMSKTFQAYDLLDDENIQVDAFISDRFYYLLHLQVEM